MNLQNKRIVITGATSGIGLDLAITIAKLKGVRIVAVGRDIEKIPAIDNIFKFKADVSKQNEMDALFDFSIQKMGGIDIFFANAGFAYYERLGVSSWNHIEDIFSTNVLAPIYSLTKMIETNKKSEFMVVVTNSVIGKLPFPGFSLYTGTKFALDGFNSAMQYEMPENGHLMMVYPVATYTDFFNRSAKESYMPWPRQTVKETTAAVLKGIKRNKKRVYPYPFIKVLLYTMNLFPFSMNIYHRIQQKKMNNTINKKNKVSMRKKKENAIFFE